MILAKLSWPIVVTEKINDSKYEYECLQEPIQFRDNFGRLRHMTGKLPLKVKSNYLLTLAVHDSEIQDFYSEEETVVYGVIHEVFHNGVALKKPVEYKNLFKKIFWYEEKFVLVDNYNLHESDGHPFEVGDRLTISLLKLE